MQKSKPSKSQAEKLKELELSGLVDFTQQHARSVADLFSSFTPACSQANNRTLLLLWAGQQRSCIDKCQSLLQRDVMLHKYSVSISCSRFTVLHTVLSLPSQCTLISFCKLSTVRDNIILHNHCRGSMYLLSPVHSSA